MTKPNKGTVEWVVFFLICITMLIGSHVAFSVNDSQHQNDVAFDSLTRWAGDLGVTITSTYCRHDECTVVLSTGQIVGLSCHPFGDGCQM